MATATRSDVYLSLLAARALTALADLANDPLAWNDNIQLGLKSGKDYCDAYGALFSAELAEAADQRNFKRGAVDFGAIGCANVDETQIEAVRSFLTKVLSRTHVPERPELSTAIDFFSAGSC